MKLLEAVNMVLPHLGEHPITRIEVSKHPTVDLILNAIEHQRRTKFAEGYWFNTVTRVIPVNTDGRIDVPDGTVAVRSDTRNITIDGAHFYDMDNDTQYFDKPIQVTLIKDIPFERLPANAALYITYHAAAEVYLQDFGNEATVSVLRDMAGAEYILLHKANLRRKDYNRKRRNRRSSLANRIRFR